jgi:hypothetical protein
MHCDAIHCVHCHPDAEHDDDPCKPVRSASTATAERGYHPTADLTCLAAMIDDTLRQPPIINVPIPRAAMRSIRRPCRPRQIQRQQPRQDLFIAGRLGTPSIQHRSMKSSWATLRSLHVSPRHLATNSCGVTVGGIGDSSGHVAVRIIRQAERANRPRLVWPRPVPLPFDP